MLSIHECSQQLEAMCFTKRDDAFIACGYKNWKWGTAGSKTHEASECHREAIEVIELPKKCADSGENTILRKNSKIGKFS